MAVFEKIMKNHACVLAILGLLLLPGCITIHVDGGGPLVQGSGHCLKEKRALSPFTDIRLSGAYEVEVLCGREEGVVVSGDDNIVPHVRTQVDGNVLEVSLDGSVSTTHRIKLTISGNTVHRLAISGATEVQVSDLANTSFCVDVSGTGRLTAQGTTEALQVALSGTGSIDTKNLKAEKASVDISGTGSAEISVSGELDAQVSGVGSIIYHGQPKTVLQKISGIGSIRAHDGSANVRVK